MQHYLRIGNNNVRVKISQKMRVTQKSNTYTGNEGGMDELIKI